ncbi:DUF6349 family protein [Nonomuraea sp. NPDC050790]|uniref:DUF6349 family protein n=1 Tax=Nonomuraea sp. NPDC050790 TaxID=3364371 RepID=UPI00378BC236
MPHEMSTRVTNGPTPGIAITHPLPGEPGGHCRTTVCSWTAEPGDPAPPTVKQPEYHLRYRSLCGGCGHTGPDRSEENAAVEDGCDHAFPGWRELPVMAERPYAGAALERWEAEARAVYPAGWFDRGGPVRATRRPMGGRHVPGYAPGGGYSMGVVRERPSKESARRIQGSLFD